MALAERKMRIMSDKKIGVLGGSGEIGKRCVNILTEKGYTVMASYRTQKPMENNENVPLESHSRVFSYFHNTASAHMSKHTGNSVKKL